MSISRPGGARRDPAPGRDGRTVARTDGVPRALDAHRGEAERRTEPSGDALAALHREHYAALVRLATLVVGDVGVAEQITQDAFVRLQLRWGGLRRLDRAP